MQIWGGHGTLVSPGVKDREGVVRLLRRSYDGQARRTIRDHRESRFVCPVHWSRRWSPNDASTHEELSVPVVVEYV